MVLTPAEARRFYDRVGSRQDRQAFYEDPALDVLLAHGAFGEARSVFELGCGTGRFAERLLARHLPPTATYHGVDLSPRMLGLAQARLARFAPRVRLELSDGSVRLPVASASVDRVVSTYVLDLLADDDIRRVFADAHRVLAPGGRLCLVSLGPGTNALSRVTMTLWRAAFRLRPQWVGGCRPVALGQYVEPAQWTPHHHGSVVAWGIPSEVLVIGRPG